MFPAALPLRTMSFSGTVQELFADRESISTPTTAAIGHLPFASTLNGIMPGKPCRKFAQLVSRQD
jgi:hypothetical protein